MEVCKKENSNPSSHLVIDTEGDFAYDPPLFLGMSLSLPLGQQVYLPFGHPYEDVNLPKETLEKAFDVIRNAPLRVFHNASHDLVVLRDIGCDVIDLPFADTMLMAHMLDENLKSKQLDFLVKHYLRIEGKKRNPLMQGIIDTMGWSHVPSMLMTEYAEQDARITNLLFLYLRPLFEKEFGPLFEGLT